MEPTDKYHATYILFYCIGVISQVPNSFFITANEYWMYKFRDTSKIFDPTDDNRSELQTQFTSNFSIVVTTCNVGFILLTILLGNRIALHIRIVTSFVVIAVLFLVTITFVLIDTDEWQTAFYAITLFVGGILTGAASILNVSGILIASRFPPKYLAAQLSGMAICGIVAALVQIISIANESGSANQNALIYFTTGVCMVVATSILYLIQNRSDFFNQHANAPRAAVDKPSLKTIKSVFQKIKFDLLSMGIMMSSTSLIYPGLTALVKSVNYGTPWYDKFFIPTITFFLYNFIDFGGREIAPRIKKPENPYWMLVLCIIRCALVPLIFFCNAQPRTHTSVPIYSDTAYIIFMIIFAFSHGYLLNICILAMPGKVPPEHSFVNVMLIFIVMLVSQMVFSFLNIAVIKLL